MRIGFENPRGAVTKCRCTELNSFIYLFMISQLNEMSKRIKNIQKANMPTVRHQDGAITDAFVLKLMTKTLYYSGGAVFSRWFQMLIFGLWLDCVLEGFNLPKNDVAIFCDFFILFSQFQITAQIVLNNFIILPQNTFSMQSKHSIYC